MRVRSTPVLGLICLGSILAMDTEIDCKDVAMSGLLDAIWFSASTQITGQQGEQGEQGEQGAPGAPGENCWDANGNGIQDPDEDVNGDGAWNTLDCQGPAGEDGQSGQSIRGEPGESGLMCWDLNENGEPDPDEDINQDNVWDARDCQGQPGAPGEPGEPGEDLTGVIARGWIPGFELDLFPRTPGFIYDPGDSAVGIDSAYRPLVGDPNDPIVTPGRYRVLVPLPERDGPYYRTEIVVLVSLEKSHVDGAPHGSGGTPVQMFGYWEIVNVDLSHPLGLITDDMLELEVIVRATPDMFAIDANFSIVVLVP
jgi:hypothetical protein